MPKINISKIIKYLCLNVALVMYLMVCVYWIVAALPQSIPMLILEIVAFFIIGYYSPDIAQIILE